MLDKLAKEAALETELEELLSQSAITLIFVENDLLFHSTFS